MKEALDSSDESRVFEREPSVMARGREWTRYWISLAIATMAASGSLVAPEGLPVYLRKSVRLFGCSVVRLFGCSAGYHVIFVDIISPDSPRRCIPH